MQLREIHIDGFGIFANKRITGLTPGINIIYGKNEFGKKYSKHLTQQIRKYVEQQLLIVSEDQLVATKKGKFLVDGIASDLFILN